MKKIKPSSRDAIIEAAFQTFGKNPGASLADVAAHAGVGRATLHRHFSSRQDLMVALAQIALQELGSAINDATAGATSHTEGLRLSLVAIIPLANRQWFLSHEPVADDPQIAEAYAAEVVSLHREIEAAKVEGMVAADLPTRWIAEAYENLVYASWTLVREGELTPNQAADLAWRTFTKGVSE